MSGVIGMHQCGVFILLAALSFGSSGAAPQSRPDFSGSWTLATFHSASNPAAGEPGVAAQTGMVSGAVVNCGRECIITQSPEELTVSRPAPKEGAQPTASVISLDGRPMSGNTTAKWDREKLVLTRALAPSLVVTQTLALEDNQLVIIVAIGTGKAGPFTLTYNRK